MHRIRAEGIFVKIDSVSKSDAWDIFYKLVRLHSAACKIQAQLIWLSHLNSVASWTTRGEERQITVFQWQCSQEARRHALSSSQSYFSLHERLCIRRTRIRLSEQRDWSNPLGSISVKAYGSEWDAKNRSPHCSWIKMSLLYSGTIIGYSILDTK